MHRHLTVRVPTLRLQDSLSERYITSRCLPAMAPKVLVMGDEVRSRDFLGRQSLQQLSRSHSDSHSNSFQVAIRIAARKTSNPRLIHVEQGLVNLHSNELNFLP